jgi:hypothetical protein
VVGRVREGRFRPFLFCVFLARGSSLLVFLVRTLSATVRSRAIRAEETARRGV